MRFKTQIGGVELIDVFNLKFLAVEGVAKKRENKKDKRVMSFVIGSIFLT